MALKFRADMKRRDTSKPERSLPGAKKPATAFFISHFDQRSHFLYRAFQEGIQEVSGQLVRQIQLQRVDALPAEPDLMAAIKKGLNSAVLAVCDITPSGPADQPQWNPNVFYELGMADQLGLPTFLVYDKDRKPTKNAGLPFDILHRSVEDYDFTPDGLGLIKEKFVRWLLQEMDKEEGRISAYEQSQHFVGIARGIKDNLYKWRGASAASFRQLLARMVTPLQSEAAKMTRFLHDRQGRSSYIFEPPGRSDAVEHLFIAMIDSLEPDDEYLTLSTLPFWRSFNDDGEAYREACRKAAGRGVLIRRLMIVPEDPDEDEERIIQAHMRAHKTVESKYELRILYVPRPQSMRPQGHVGVCHRKELGVTTAFQPHYDDGEPPRVVAIRLRDDAEDAAREFEEKWKKTSGPRQRWPAD